MTRRRVGTIWVFTTLLAAGALALHWLAVRPLPAAAVLGESGPAWLWPVLLGSAFLLAESFTLNLRLGRHALQFSMVQIPLVLGLFFLAPQLLVVVRLAGSAVSLTLVERRTPQKVVFNLAMFALETALAVAVFHAVLGGGEALGPRGWLAALGAGLLMSALSAVTVGAVVGIDTGRRAALRELLGLGNVGDLANACFGLIAVYILAVEWRAAWLFVVLGAVLVFAFRSYEGARQRTESLEQVNRFTELVGREVELEALVGTVLHEVRNAFGVGRAHVRLREADGTVSDWCLDGDEPVLARSSLADVLERWAAGELVLVPRRTRVPALADLLQAEGVRDCVLVPLRSEGRWFGSLVLADRAADAATFGEPDVHQLRSLANHAAVAIDNAVRAQLLIAQAEERERQALYDDLTGLPNRHLLGIRLTETLRERPAALLLLDLDRFKEVNDTLGHEVGDRLLSLVAERLTEAVHPGTLVAHLGGDEFAILLPGAGADRAATSATHLQEQLGRPFELGGMMVAVSAGIGTAAGEPGDGAAGLLRRADLAMHAAKDRRTGVEAYRPELDRRDASRLGLLADLRLAVAAGSLAVHYQPKVDLESGLVEGVEALARWIHPDHGFVPPDQFIPLAEHSSLITPLTMLVLRTALADCASWGHDGSGRFSVAVNISPRSLLDPQFVDEVARLLAEAGLPAGVLTLEITETSLMSDPDRAIEALQRLRDLGVGLSVDDLGTGYSSLAYLQRLPVHEIKIDRSFLLDFPDPSAEAVVGAIVDLGHRLGHRVVAEGVEDGEAYARLGELGCDSAQGYWLGRPVDAAQTGRVLAAWSPPGPAYLRGVR